MTKDHKQYCTQSAIYRMLRTKRITPKQTEVLLHTRAKLKPDVAKGLRDLWLTSYPIKQAWGES